MGRCRGIEQMSRRMVSQSFRWREADSPSTTSGIVGDRLAQIELLKDNRLASARWPFSSLTKTTWDSQSAPIWTQAHWISSSDIMVSTNIWQRRTRHWQGGCISWGRLRTTGKCISSHQLSGSILCSHMLLHTDGRYHRPRTLRTWDSHASWYHRLESQTIKL